MFNPQRRAPLTGIFKYIDNIMALYAHVSAMMIVVVCSALFFRFTISATFVCGFLVCIISLFLYNHTPGPPAAADAVQGRGVAVQPLIPTGFGEGMRLLKPMAIKGATVER